MFSCVSINIFSSTLKQTSYRLPHLESSVHRKPSRTCTCGSVPAVCGLPSSTRLTRCPPGLWGRREEPPARTQNVQQHQQANRKQLCCLKFCQKCHHWRSLSLRRGMNLVFIFFCFWLASVWFHNSPDHRFCWRSLWLLSQFLRSILDVFAMPPGILLMDENLFEL